MKLTLDMEIPDKDVTRMSCLQLYERYLLPGLQILKNQAVAGLTEGEIRTPRRMTGFTYWPAGDVYTHNDCPQGGKPFAFSGLPDDLVCPFCGA